MITINKEACIGCGLCKQDCFSSAIDIIQEKAEYTKKSCMQCGHCLAICPKNAITIDTLDMNEVMELKDMEYTIPEDTYLNHIKARRSIRSFQDKVLTKDQLEKIIEVGRYSPTGGNAQMVRYHVFTDKVHELRELLLKELNDIATEMVNEGSTLPWYPRLWLSMYKEFKEEKVDKLFFDAPSVIVVSSPSPQAAIISASHMESMIYSMGLGMLYSGFSNTAIMHSSKLQEYIQLPEGYQVWAVLIVGYPNVTYKRTVPRKKADIIWK